METSTPLSCRAVGVRHHSRFARAFPTPAFVTPHAAGVDISDSSIKWLSLKPATSGWEVETYGSVKLDEGIVEAGSVQDPKRLGEALRTLRKSVGGTRFAHAALPEEAAYVFHMRVPNAYDRDQVMHLIEFELEGRVPLKSDAAVYDYDIIACRPDGTNAELGVVVFPQQLVAGYQEAFAHSGVELLSLELEARSIARAVIAGDSTEVNLLADFGRARAGIAVLRGQVPIFTSTVGVGGATLTNVIMEQLGVSREEAEEFKNEHGLMRSADETNKRVQEAVLGTASAFADEVMRHYRYWDTRRNEEGQRVTPVARILLAGGSANLRWLDEYIAGRVQAPTTVANPWRNVCRFDDYVPPIDRHHSLGYATAIGLALRSV